MMVQPPQLLDAAFLSIELANNQSTCITVCSQQQSESVGAQMEDQETQGKADINKYRK